MRSFMKQNSCFNYQLQNKHFLVESEPKSQIYFLGIAVVDEGNIYLGKQCLLSKSKFCLNSELWVLTKKWTVFPFPVDTDLLLCHPELHVEYEGDLVSRKSKFFSGDIGSLKNVSVTVVHLQKVATDKYTIP